jgi:hypothetical protein
MQPFPEAKVLSWGTKKTPHFGTQEHIEEAALNLSGGQHTPETYAQVMTLTYGALGHDGALAKIFDAFTVKPHGGNDQKSKPFPMKIRPRTQMEMAELLGDVVRPLCSSDALPSQRPYASPAPSASAASESADMDTSEAGSSVPPGATNIQQLRSSVAVSSIPAPPKSHDEMKKILTELAKKAPHSFQIIDQNAYPVFTWLVECFIVFTHPSWKIDSMDWTNELPEAYQRKASELFGEIRHWTSLGTVTVSCMRDIVCKFFKTFVHPNLWDNLMFDPKKLTRGTGPPPYWYPNAGHMTWD